MIRSGVKKCGIFFLFIVTPTIIGVCYDGMQFWNARIYKFHFWGYNQMETSILLWLAISLDYCANMMSRKIMFMSQADKFFVSLHFSTSLITDVIEKDL